MPSFRDLIRRRPKKHVEESASVSRHISEDAPVSATGRTTPAPSHQPTTAQPPETVAPTSTTNEQISEKLWSQAYKILREKDLELLEGYEKHLGALPDAPDGSLSNPATVTTLVQRLQDDRQGQQWQLSFRGKEHKIRDQVEKLVKLFVFSDSVIKQAVSAQPYAALAWSGVSIFLPLLSGAFTKDEAMVKGFTVISDIQLYWKTCEDTYLASSSAEHYQNLIVPLSTVYSHIMEYQIRAICYLAGKQSSRAWQKVAGWSEWSDKASSIAKASEGCKAYFEPLQQREVQMNFKMQVQRLDQLCETERDILHTMVENRREDKSIKLLQSLASVASTYATDKDFNPKQVQGTCEWLFNDQGFCDWRDRPNSGLFWISAGPGCGKSVLSRALIDGGHLSSTVSTITISSSATVTERNTIICYFFFKDDDSRRTSIANALCAILHQLFSSDTTQELIQHGIPAYERNGKSLLQSFVDLWKILTDCAESWSAGDIICVLDAMDECNSQDCTRFLSTLEDYYSENRSPGKLKFFITSRPYDNIERSFRPFSDRAQFLRFDGDERYDEISSDINLVIDARINEFAADFKLEDRKKISDHLKSRGTRTYLWLHLTLSIINGSPSEYSRRREVENLLSEIPSQVSEAYEKILQRSTNEKMTTTLLQILLMAARPLTVTEANYALTMALAETPFHEHASIARECWTGDFKSIVKNLCGLIISVYDHQLSFIHLTAREFLLSDPEENMKWKGRFEPSFRLSETISQCCITYLLLDDWVVADPETIPPQKLRSVIQFPFLNYASNHWAHHLRSLGSTASDSMKQQARQLMAANGPYTRIWGTAYLTDMELDHRVLSGWTDLAMASLLGFYTVVEETLATANIDVNAPSLDLGSALQAAARAGQGEIVDLLISHGADVNTTNRTEGSVLEIAIRRRNIDLVDRLLRHGADARPSKYHFYNSAIGSADFTGDRGIFCRILGNFVNLDTLGGIEAAVLIKGALGGDFRYMEMLLDVLGPDMPLTQRMVDVLMYDREVSSRVLVMILDRRKGKFSIKPDMLGEVISNDESIDVLRRLLADKAEFDLVVTEDLIKSVAQYGDVEKMRLFLEYFDAHDGISREILISAALNMNNQASMMKLLLDYRGGIIENGEDILEKALSRRGLDAMKILLDHPGFHFNVTSSVFCELVIMMSREAQEWDDIFNRILSRTEVEVLEDDMVLTKMAKSATGEWMELVLNRLGDDYVPSESVLCSAAGVIGYSRCVLEMLMKRHGNRIKLTRKVFLSAVQNPHLFDWLLATRGHEVEVTEKFLEETMGMISAPSLKVLLHWKRDDVVRLAPIVLLNAVRNYNVKALELLVDNGVVTQDMFTEEVLLDMLTEGELLFLMLDYFKRMLLEQTTIGAELMERIAMHSLAVGLLEFIKSRRPECFCITEGMIKAAATNGTVEALHYLSRRQAEAAAAAGEESDGVVPVDDKWYLAAQFRRAADNDNFKGMQLALDQGADPNLPNLDGVTAISSAADRLGLDVVQFLAARPNVHVNAADKNGATPLHRAVNKGGESVVRILIDAGADPDKADKEGLTPYMFAKKKWGTEGGIIEILKEAQSTRVQDIQ